LSDSERRSVSSNRAVAQLLTQADNLIAEEHFAQATDKLERLVRIEPRFAQAWSRLSWMALKNGDAERSRQVAQRSNSYSRDNNQLTLLNWHFIKNAGELLGNNDIIQQAEKMITTLGVRY
jgi:Tfp pilus assembly protein PilF